MEPSVDELVRWDRIGYYHRYGAWRYFPMQGPTYGDLWLTRDGKVGFTGVGGLLNSDSWATTLSEVRNIARATKSIMFWCAKAMPSASFEADFGDKRELIAFLGIKRFLTKGETWIARIPGVHHAGAFAVEAKSLYQNRGSRARAEEALSNWLQILDGSVNVSTLPLLKDGLDEIKA